MLLILNLSLLIVDFIRNNNFKVLKTTRAYYKIIFAIITQRFFFILPSKLTCKKVSNFIFFSTLYPLSHYSVKLILVNRIKAIHPKNEFINIRKIYQKLLRCKGKINLD